MFNSFYLAGFESSQGINAHGEFIDQVVATEHDKFVNEDYARVAALGIRAVREAVRWPLVDQRGKYDFSTLDPFLRAARIQDIQIVWDLFHFGYPNDLDLFSLLFAERFEEYCFNAVRYLSARTDAPLWIVPVNEPSFFAWAAGEASLFAPHARGRSQELKYRLIEAAVRGINAAWSAAPETQILSVDPLCHVVAPQGDPDLEWRAKNFNEEVVFESWDMLAGKKHPELGGSMKHLGTMGINYYWTNQWQLATEGQSPVELDSCDPRRLPLSALVQSVYNRYHAPMMISETSHHGDSRANWLRTIDEELDKLNVLGISLEGVCLYPVLNMPEWHATNLERLDTSTWAKMGLWDMIRTESGIHREPHLSAIDAFTSLKSVLRDASETVPGLTAELL